MTRSELFLAAHALTRRTIQEGDSYRVTFGSALRYLLQVERARTATLSTIRAYLPTVDAPALLDAAIQTVGAYAGPRGAYAYSAFRSCPGLPNFDDGERRRVERGGPQAGSYACYAVFAGVASLVELNRAIAA